MKTIIKINACQQIVVLYKQLSVRTHQTDTCESAFTTSDRWSYLHKKHNISSYFLILKHVLLRLMKKYIIPVINCLLCCMNWYSWGVIRRSHRIRTRSNRIRIVVKFYNRTLRLRWGYFSLNDFWHSDASRAWRSKTPTTFYPLKTARSSRDGNYSFEFFPFHPTHA